MPDHTLCLLRSPDRVRRTSRNRIKYKEAISWQERKLSQATGK